MMHCLAFGADGSHQSFTDGDRAAHVSAQACWDLSASDDTFTKACEGWRGCQPGGTHIVALAHTGGQDSPTVVKHIFAVGVALEVQRDAGVQLLSLRMPDQDMLGKPPLLLDLQALSVL